MIIGTFMILEVGKIIKLPKLEDGEGNMHYDIPALIMREASLNEYLKWCDENSSPEALQGNNHNKDNARFYEISID